MCAGVGGVYGFGWGLWADGRMKTWRDKEMTAGAHTDTTPKKGTHSGGQADTYQVHMRDTHGIAHDQVQVERVLRTAGREPEPLPES